MEKLTVSELLKKDLKGKTVIFPTDTVYGLGCLYSDKEAITKIYQMKLRPDTKPLPVLVHDYEFLKHVENGDKFKDKLIKKWPGAHTAIFKCRDDEFILPSLGKKTTAFRMPNSRVALTILGHFGYLATTSANISGSLPLLTLTDLEKAFKDKVDYLVTDEETFTGQASEIIDYTNKEAKLR